MRKKGFVFKNIRAGREQKNFTLFFVWLLSYVFVLLIPILSFLGGIYAYERNYSRHIDQFHTSLVTATASGIKEILVDINELQSMLLLHNPNISEVLSINQPNLYYGSKEVINFVSDLSVYKTYKSNIDFMFIYVEDTDIIIHETGAYDSHYFYNIYFKGTVPYEEWKKQLCQSYHNNARYFSTSVRINDNLKDAVCFRSTLSPSSFIAKPLRSNLFILVDEERFFRSIDVGIDYCDTYIFDSRGNTLLYNLKTSDPIVPKNLRELANSKSGISLKMQNLSFQATEMTVALLIPTKLLNNGLTSSRMIVIGLVAVCLALASLLITYFMKKNYSPLESIMSGLNIPKGDSRTEMGSLGERVKQLFTSNAALSNTINAQSSLLHDFTLTQLLSGTFGTAPSPAENIKYVSEFVYKNFLVVIFSWNSLDQMFDDDSISNEEKINEMYFIIKNIFEEVFTDEKSVAKVVTYGEMPVCIINTDKGIQDNENVFEEKAAYGCEIIKKNFLVNIEFTFSSYYGSLYEISSAFSEAKRTLNYKNSYSATFLQPERQNNGDENIYDYPLELEEKLTSAMCRGDSITAQNVICSIFEVLASRKASREYTNCIIGAIVSTLMRIPANSESKKNFLNLMSSDDIEHRKNVILSYLQALCDESAAKDDPPASLPEKALKYVLENYTSATLGVNTIAAYFGVSSFYLSKVFKESYRHTLVDFIHEYRLEKATELIRSNKYSFVEISEMLGYNHIRTFNRVFKKYVGVTPSEYKKSIT